MMLKYLATLTRGKPFEEMFYYEDLLNVLGSAPPFYATVGRGLDSTHSTKRLLHRVKRAVLKCFTKGVGRPLVHGRI
jgi:hypothetical protein